MTTLELEDPAAPPPPLLVERVGWGKRVFDVVVGGLLCLVAIPLVVVLAGVLAAQHRGNPFFVHERIGFRGALVRIPKLRTLPAATDPYADKTTNDLLPVSRLASYLRRKHIDELPQLLLVPFGRLSLVGPRPRMPQEAAATPDPPFDGQRIAVQQGCTGLWQISAYSRHRVSDNPQFDLFYVEHRTARLDGWILWRTVVQHLGARPIDLDDVPRWTLRRGSLAFELVG